MLKLVDWGNRNITPFKGVLPIWLPAAILNFNSNPKSDTRNELIGIEILLYHVPHLLIHSTSACKPVIDTFQIWPPAAILDFENIFFCLEVFCFLLRKYEIVIHYYFSVKISWLEWEKHKPSFLVHPIWPPAAILNFEILRGQCAFLIRDILRSVYANFGACIIMWTIPL